MLSRALEFVRGLKAEAELAPESPYKAGYIDALGEVEEWISEEVEWED